MARLFKFVRRGKIVSQFWWIEYRDPEQPVTNKSGRVIPVRKSTGLRIGVGDDTRKARELVAKHTLNERSTTEQSKGPWDKWVTSFIENKTSGGTTVRYKTCWRSLRLYLDEFKILFPCQVTYLFCDGYIQWRLKPDRSIGKYTCRVNTAILEFKIFRWILREAVKRDYCKGNPAREVVLKRGPKKVYPDYADEHLQKFYQTILTKTDLNDRIRFARCYAISLLQGVRLNETNVNPMKDVNLSAEIPTIRFLQKGKRERIKPLHPRLFPLFKKLQDAGATQTLPNRDDGLPWAWHSRWHKFFEDFKSAIPNATFHGLRVTVENVLRQAKIPKEIREEYLSHEHEDDVNSMYDRIKIEEMVTCHKPLDRPWLDALE